MLKEGENKCYLCKEKNTDFYIFYYGILQNSHGGVKYSIGNGVAKEPTHDPGTWTIVWGWPERVGVRGEQRGENWETVTA